MIGFGVEVWVGVGECFDVEEFVYVGEVIGVGVWLLDQVLVEFGCVVVGVVFDGVWVGGMQVYWVDGCDFQDVVGEVWCKFFDLCDYVVDVGVCDVFGLVGVGVDEFGGVGIWGEWYFLQLELQGGGVFGCVVWIED